MSALMIESIKVWEQDARQLNYHSVGYLAVAGPRQASDLVDIARRHEAASYPHTLVEGIDACNAYLRGLFADWKDSDASAVLHEHQGGFAYSLDAIRGLAKLVAGEGVRIVDGVEVTGFDLDPSDERVRTVHTSAGSIDVEWVVAAVGPWIKNLWTMLELPPQIDVRDRRGELYPNRDMWTFWQLQEGEVVFENDEFTLADGKTPPVVHVDSEEPLYAEDGTQITDGPWGIYFKRHHGNVQGGAVPLGLGNDAEVDPYGAASPYYIVDDDFVAYWTAGLARTMRRFEGCKAKYKHEASGGIGCFSVDNFPVFDFMRPNCYVIADSNHGFKMIGVGKEVASVLAGQTSKTLQPFRFSRFVEGELHPVSNSPFPWA